MVRACPCSLYDQSHDGHVVRQSGLTQRSLLHSAVGVLLDHRIIEYVELEGTHNWVTES